MRKETIRIPKGAKPETLRAIAKWVKNYTKIETYDPSTLNRGWIDTILNTR